MGILKEAYEYYKERKREEKAKKMLINKNTNWAYLEQLIIKMNENPNLRIDVHTIDGTVIRMRCYEKKETHDLINGNYEVIE